MSAASDTLRRAHIDLGLVDETTIAVLDELDPGWRDDPDLVEWMEVADDYDAWVAEHGAVPERTSVGAVGLRPWMDQQDPDILTTPQIRRLERTIGWRSTIDARTSDPAWAIVAGLLPLIDETPHRPQDRIVGGWQAAQWIAAGRQPAAIDLRGPIDARLLSVALFVARYGAAPTHTDPDGRWFSHARGTAGPVGDIVRNLVSNLGQLPPLSWRRGAARYERFIAEFDREPSPSAQSRTERGNAVWAQRQRRAFARGELYGAQADFARERLGR